MKHKIKLADNFEQPVFFTDWDTNLIGDALRTEFLVFLEERKKELGIVAGGTKRIFVDAELQRFMNIKGINMVRDEESGTTKSQFVIRKDEELEIDDSAWSSIQRLEYKTTTQSDGTESEPLGYILHLGKTEKKEPKDVEVSGETVKYFEKTEDSDEKPDEPATPAEFKCDKCDKSFPTAMQLRGHMMNHK